MKKNNYYQILGIQPTASTSEIKSAYKELALSLHPDRLKSSSTSTTFDFSVVASAYATLVDEQSRAEYDSSLDILYSASDYSTPTKQGVKKGATPKSVVYTPTGSSRRLNRRMVSSAVKAKRLKKHQALEAISLMSMEYESKYAIEEARGGLCIVKAVYGDLSDQSKSAYSSCKIIDVTIPLQIQVSESKLVIPADVSKSVLEGFYTPGKMYCNDDDKKIGLRVMYYHGGVLHEATVGDYDELRIPLRVHSCSYNSITNLHTSRLKKKSSSSSNASKGCSNTLRGGYCPRTKTLLTATTTAVAAALWILLAGKRNGTNSSSFSSYSTASY